MPFLISLLSGPFGRIITWALIALVGLTIALGWLAMHDHAVKQEATQEFNRKQMEQVLEDNKKLLENQKQLAESLKTINTELSQKLTKLDDLSVAIDDALAQKNFKDFNEQAPDTIKEVLRQLRQGLK